MPIASWILLSVIIGSAAGAAGEPVSATVAALACVALSLHLRRHGPLVAAAPLLLAVGAAARATAERWQDAHCRAQVLRAPQREFVTDFDLGNGDASPGVVRAIGGRCETRVMVRARSSLRGGEWYRTADRAEPGTTHLQLTVRTSESLHLQSLRPALRAAGVRRVDSVFTVDAPMARALLLADMHLIAPDMRRRWSRSGLVHLLSVSGVHVAIIASALLLACSALRLPPRHATVVALSITALYVIILGLPPPAVRAGVMFGSLHIARLRQRPASQWSVLTLGALLPVLVEPRAPLDLGWQLSVLGVVALGASGRLTRRLGLHSGGWRSSLQRELVASIVASAASAPIIAWYFGTVSLIAPLTNLVAAPLVTLLQPTLFLALLCAPWLPLARFVAGAAHPVLRVLDGIAASGAAPHWAAVDLAPALSQALLGGVMMGALMVAMIQQAYAQPLLLAATTGALLMWSDFVPSHGSGVLELHLLDVGQGDAVALRTPHGRWVLVDAGGGAPGIDRGRRTVLPYVRRYGGDVEAFVLSHPHLDHVGGAPAIIGALRPRYYFDGAFAGGTEAYRASLESASVHHVAWRRVHPGDTLRVDGVLLRFLAPDSTWTAHLDDANLASTILRVEYGQVAMLLVGDAELAEEAWLLEHTPAAWLRADVLKVGHHGSRTSSGSEFLDAVAPALALVSVGRGNNYRHPSPEVMESFARRQITAVRTDMVGTTVVRTDGRGLSVTTAARQWTLPSRASARGAGPGSADP